mmetsp:Transcript_17517/g.22930  ORF Transcript_17517/g.22930 Transcript_17517/m.22930 type:complete len:315 (+) Transcript_17517:222-1166(+)
MPVCKYGTACLYKKTCIYRHPKTAKPVKSDKICTAFLAGLCEFGSKCLDRHPDEEECQAIRAKFAARMCMYGSSCRTEGCLYSHPIMNDSLATQVSKITIGSAAGSGLRPTAKEWTPPSSTAPQSMPAPTESGPYGTLNGSAGTWATAASRPLQDSVASSSTLTGRQLSNTPRKVKIPIELWLNEYDRPANAFSISDPEERYQYVNAPYRTDGRVQALNSLGVTVMDLHYQSKTTAAFILDAHLAHELEMSKKGCWIITGTGHHTAVNSHQQKAAGGVLFKCVTTYLKEEEYRFNIGQDMQGNSGALLVLKPKP